MPITTQQQPSTEFQQLVWQAEWIHGQLLSNPSAQVYAEDHPVQYLESVGITVPVIPGYDAISESYSDWFVRAFANAEQEDKVGFGPFGCMSCEFAVLSGLVLLVAHVAREFRDPTVRTLRRAYNRGRLTREIFTLAKTLGVTIIPISNLIKFATGAESLSVPKLLSLLQRLICGSVSESTGGGDVGCSGSETAHMSVCNDLGATINAGNCWVQYNNSRTGAHLDGLASGQCTVEHEYKAQTSIEDLAEWHFVGSFGTGPLNKRYGHATLTAPYAPSVFSGPLQVHVGPDELRVDIGDGAHYSTPILFNI
jgi:hypothetical protein